VFDIGGGWQIKKLFRDEEAVTPMEPRGKGSGLTGHQHLVKAVFPARIGIARASRQLFNE
jgi:hypothetical protein